jgi:hypothetical protein
MSRPAPYAVRSGATALAAAAGLALTLALSPAPQPAAAHRPPSVYVLDGDPAGPAGSKFEGIGVDRPQRTFYVSEITGGEIHRGVVRDGDTEVWLDEGADGRSTARGITVDRAGRVYIAGGPNSVSSGGPDFWVYGPDGNLLAALRTELANPFLNDVVIGPDGAAYVTNSNAPVIFRVAPAGGSWRLDTWADARDTIQTRPGFNLGGIVVGPDRRSRIVAQGNVGRLWRFDLRTRRATPVDTGEANLANADGLFRRGRTLWVIRNVDRTLTTLRLDGQGQRARLLAERATDPDRVFTTGKIARGRLLLVDSKFDEQVAAPPYEVVAVDLRR